MKLANIGINIGITNLERNLINKKINKLLNPFRKLQTDTVDISKEMSIFTKRLQSLEESQTMKKLFSPEYKISQGKNKDGFYVTTIIDIKTNKPIKAYVKKTCRDDNYEKWCIFIKNIRGDYQPVGERSFEIDLGLNRITPGEMSSEMGNYKYSGIGIRLHQIAIERMIQEDLKNVQICSTQEAFPFHYKCGFRVIPFERTIKKGNFEKMLEEYSQNNKIDKKILYQNSEIIEEKNGIIRFSTKYIENWRKLLYAKGNHVNSYCDYPMKLSEKAIENWKNQISFQPILEH